MMSLSSNVTHHAELLEKLRSREKASSALWVWVMWACHLSLTYAEVGYRVLGLILIKPRPMPSIKARAT